MRWLSGEFAACICVAVRFEGLSAGRIVVFCRRTYMTCMFIERGIQPAHRRLGHVRHHEHEH